MKRVQLSINVDDLLFESFIEPYKKNKQLQTLIKKLLSCYCYDEDFRNQVDNTVIVNEEDEHIKAAQIIIDNTRASLGVAAFEVKEPALNHDILVAKADNLTCLINMFCELTGRINGTISNISIEKIRDLLINLNNALVATNAIYDNLNILKAELASVSDIADIVSDEYLNKLNNAVALEHQLTDFYNEVLIKEQELRDYIRGSSDTLNLALERLILI